MSPRRTPNALLSLLLGVSLAAQQSGPAATAPPAALALLLRDPEARPLAGVPVTLHGRTTATLPALANVPLVPPFAAALGSPTPLVGTSDARGFVRLRSENDVRVLDGSGLVTTERGLGALVADLHEGQPQRLDLQPMAALHHQDGVILRVFARALLPHGRQLVLPPLQGERVLLPPAEYELWVHDGGAWLWLRIRLASGQVHTLPVEAGTRTLQCPAGTRLHPDDRPDVPLCENGGPVVLRGAARAAALWAWHSGNAHGPHVPVDAGRGDDEPWPVPDEPVTTRVEAPGGSAATGVVIAVRRLGTRWQPLWIRRDDEATWRTLPTPAPGDVWLVQVAAPGAPLAQPWSERAQRLEPGRAAAALVGAVRDAAGLPLGDLACEFEPDGMPPATVRARSDGRGVLQLGAVHGPGTLRVVDPRFVNQALEIGRVPKEPLPLTAMPGASLEGVARWPDGSPARGVVVTLRDPSGTLRPAERAMPSADDGTFRFDGLPEQRAVLLFAVAIRDGRTWSGRIERMLAGPGPVTIVLEDEDPVLGR